MTFFPGHHVLCNFPMSGHAEHCRQCKDLFSKDRRWKLIEEGKYTEEIMSMAEKIFSQGWKGQHPNPHFEDWLDTPTAPTQSHFAKLARLALENGA